jgi:undecaprenyl-diphosphatase
MDIALTQWINGFAGHSPALDRAMIAVSQFGVPLIVAFVVLQWWSKTDRAHMRHAAISAGLAFLLGLAANQVILLFVHRMRPYDAGVSQLLIEKSADWSFPSDHATASVAVAVALLLQRLPLRAAVAVLAALLICLSRVYIGIHYAFDVLGGAAVGAVVAVVVARLYREGNWLDRMAVRIF